MVTTTSPTMLGAVGKGIRESHLVTVLLTSIWLLTLFQYVVPMLLLIPVMFLPVVGTTLYRKLTGMYDRWALFALFALPFSWCGLRISFHNYAHFRELKSRGNALLLSSHCSRIDWIVGTYLSALFGTDDSGPNTFSRVGFVAEATLALMPVLGWKMMVFGDIFVTRAFDKDAPRILRNIQSFHKSGIKRLIFLAPEGFIADPGSAAGENYVSDCETFMTACGRKPMTNLLTPRYKGMQHFLKHAPDNVGACAMAFVSGHSTIDKESGTVVGGQITTLPLRHADRSVPDLHDVFRGGLSVFVSFHNLKLPHDVDPEELKSILMTDQVVKDDALSYFAAHRKFDGMGPGDSWAHVQCPPLLLNGVFIAHTLLSLLVCTHLFGMPLALVLLRIGQAVVAIMAVHGVTHFAATMLSTGGQSQESLVGETAIKAGLGGVAKLVAASRSALKGPSSNGKGKLA